MLGRPLMIEPRVHERVRRVVVDLLGVHRAHDADVVRDARRWRETGLEISCPDLPCFWNSTNGPRAFSSEFCNCASCWPLVNDAGKGLAVDTLQLRLVVKALQVRRPARHAEMNDALGPHREMRRVDHALPASGAARRRLALPIRPVRAGSPARCPRARRPRGPGRCGG